MQLFWLALMSSWCIHQRRMQDHFLAKSKSKGDFQRLFSCGNPFPRTSTIPDSDQRLQSSQRRKTLTVVVVAIEWPRFRFVIRHIFHRCRVTIQSMFFSGLVLMKNKSECLMIREKVGFCSSSHEILFTYMSIIIVAVWYLEIYYYRLKLDFHAKTCLHSSVKLNYKFWWAGVVLRSWSLEESFGIDPQERLWKKHESFEYSKSLRRNTLRKQFWRTA